MRRFVQAFGAHLAGIVFSGAALGCNPESPESVTPTFPDDQPVSCAGAAQAGLRKLMQPYVERALQTYPDAKARYLRGLPAGQVFFLTTVFRHSDHLATSRSSSKCPPSKAT